MSAINVDLPDDLRSQIAGRAARQGVTEAQWLQEAAREKLAMEAEVESLKRRGSRADRGAYDRILNRVPDVEPEAGDTK